MATIKVPNPVSLKPLLYFACLLVLLGLSRYLPLDYPQLFNFTPALAIFLISGAYLKGHLAWITPILSVILTDFALSHNYGHGLFEPFMLVTLLSYSLIFCYGKYIKANGSLLSTALHGAMAALVFHLITCLFAWWVNPAYTKSLTGLFHATIFGEPGYAPAYLFLRNSILSTVLFATLLAFSAKRYFLPKTQLAHSLTQGTGNAS